MDPDPPAKPRVRCAGRTKKRLQCSCEFPDTEKRRALALEDRGWEFDEARGVWLCPLHRKWKTAKGQMSLFGGT